YFFFQAEDGIRDYKVTGVQTCALPILSRGADADQLWLMLKGQSFGFVVIDQLRVLTDIEADHLEIFSGKIQRMAVREVAAMREEIGRASCRERGQISVGSVPLINKEVI